MSKGNLIRSNRAIFNAERSITQQRAIIARLASRGLDTYSDEKLLMELLQRLEILGGRRQRFLDYRDRPVPFSYRTGHSKGTS